MPHTWVSTREAVRYGVTTFLPFTRIGAHVRRLIVGALVLIILGTSCSLDPTLQYARQLHAHVQVPDSWDEVARGDIGPLEYTATFVVPADLDRPESHLRILDELHPVEADQISYTIFGVDGVQVAAYAPEREPDDPDCTVYVHTVLIDTGQATRGYPEEPFGLVRIRVVCRDI